MNDPSIGKLIEGAADRDAIHVAIHPAICKNQVRPGTSVAIEKVDRQGLAVVYPSIFGDRVGIVDPFLTETVPADTPFWLFLLPKTVTSLRHHWTHPEFPDPKPDAADPRDAPSESEAWLRDFADNANMSYKQLLESADEYVSTGDFFRQYGGQEAQNWMEGREREFWMHYQILTGRRVPEEMTSHNYFSCSC